MTSTITPIDPLENWFDFRVQLLWAYDGPLTKWHSCDMKVGPVTAWLLRKGTVDLTYDQSPPESFTAGRWIFPRNEDGWQEFSKDTELLSIRFAAEWPTGQPLFDRSKTCLFPVRTVPQMTRVAERLARLVASRYPGVHEELRRLPGTPEQFFELQRLLYRWMLEYTAAMKSAGLAPCIMGQVDSRVRAAVHALEMRTVNLPLRERELAGKVGLSVSQLSRLFIRDIGKTPADFWEQRRIRSVRLALLQSDQSIKSIAFEMGFGSLSHFSSWTKKKLGKSPLEFRRTRNGAGT